LSSKNLINNLWIEDRDIIKISKDIMGIIKTVGKYVRYYRKKRQLTQEELAEKCNLHPTYIAKIERGFQVCSLKTLERIAIGLNVPIQALFGHIPHKDLMLYSIQNKYLQEILENGSKFDKNIIFTMAEMLVKKRKKINT